MSKERALIGTDQRGVPIVLATDGESIGFDCEEISTSAEDVGLAVVNDVSQPGLYLWEGTAKIVDPGGSWMGPSEPYTQYKGTLRPVLPEEVASLYAMTPPARYWICGKRAEGSISDEPLCGNPKCLEAAKEASSSQEQR